MSHNQKDLRHLDIKIIGPPDTPYAGGIFEAVFYYPKDYPMVPPLLTFNTPIYHPNIDLKSGTICLNVLNEEWQPIYTLKHILETFIPQLLTYPNPDDPLNIEAAEMYKSNYEKFKKCVTDFIKKQNDFHKK